MSGTRVGMVRVIALGFCLALALLLLAAREAEAAKYSVAQCGWYVGVDATWADSTGGAKFRPDAYCVPPPSHDPFEGTHMKSFGREGEATVSGTRYARWRWEAPAGTAITRVSGTWWHALHDGMQHRIGVGTWGGGFDSFATATGTDTALRNFAVGVSPPQPALEDRLLCARPETGWCSLSPGSWSGVRALTITIEDNHAPAAALGGELMAGGWRRGIQYVDFSGTDVGGGMRFGETTIDGARVDLIEYVCAKALVGSEWRATHMRPCVLAAGARAAIGTAGFGDGHHSVRHCVTDFAGNVGCTPLHTVSFDNTPPAHPRSLSAGGEGWRRANDFDLGWVNPDQSPGSPIGGAYWRMVGPGGFDTGVRFVPGRGIAAIPDRTVPAPGVYAIEVWLRDEAGNENRNSAVAIPLRFDNVAPEVAFEPVAGEAAPALPDVLRARVTDLHSGAARGDIFFRRLNEDRWTELPTRLADGDAPERASLTARIPGDLEPGTYVFRADVVDAAGNEASSRRRLDGGEMALRKLPPPPAVAERREARQPARPGAKSRLFAHLRWRSRRGPRISVPFGSAAILSGRLVDADGAGLAGRVLRVVSRPSRGSHSGRRVERVRTGEHGGFRLPMAAGTSRRISVGFAGENGLAAARRDALLLRVRGGVVLAVAPRSLRTGDTVRLWGRVRARGATLPRRGKLIAIQYWETAARRWRPVLVVRSDHSGRFRTRYRFRYVSGTAAIQLRAAALAEERWPYAPGASAPVTVRVTGSVSGG